MSEPIVDVKFLYNNTCLKLVYFHSEFYQIKMLFISINCNFSLYCVVKIKKDGTCHLLAETNYFN